VARFYSNENIALQVVTELRGLGHDVLTSLDAGKANAAVPDVEVLALAVAEGRILIVEQSLPLSGTPSKPDWRPCWFVVCTFDPDSGHKLCESTRLLQPCLRCGIRWCG
jgi:Domain of unknown function (DUF5615)